LKREFQDRQNPSLAEMREAVLRIRLRKAMLLREGDPDCRSAGSFFKNPIVTPAVFEQIEAQVPDEQVPRYPAPAGMVKTAAAWLIERSGVHRGFCMGPAGVSSKHTLALINKGGATAADLVALAREIRKRVEDRFGIRLVPEPMFVGFDEATSAEFGRNGPG
jgi:UDP-N-acetylmuramate dehydrogenase